MPLARSALTLSLLVISASAHAEDALALFQSKPCVACHSIEQKMLGPSLKEVAAKYADTPDAVATVARHIQHGSTNRWGAIPMPPNAVTEVQAQQLAAWVLSLK